MPIFSENQRSMQSVELRQSKAATIPILIALIVSVISVNYLLYRSPKFSANTTVIGFYILLNLVMLLGIYQQLKSLLRNKPIITFTDDSLIINENARPQSFLWTEIKNISIDSDDENKYLIIQSVTETKKLNLSWLEITPYHLNLLINRFRTAVRK